MTNLTLDLTPGIHTLIVGPHTSSKTAVLQSLTADAESAGHRVLALDNISTAAYTAFAIATELEHLESSQAQPGLLILAIDDLDRRFGASKAIAEATRPGASSRIHLVATAETGSGVEDFIDYAQTIPLNRLQA